jgi:peroxiredoxin
MARTLSNMLPLGTKISDFNLQNALDDNFYTFQSLKGESATVVMFICNHCPFVIHLHQGIQSIIKDFESTKVRFIAINSNDIANYPQDGPIYMKKLFNDLSLEIPYLFDADQSVAKAFDAACTPDFYVFNGLSELVYRGQFDDSRPGNGLEVTGADLRSALENLLTGASLVENQVPSLGCGIKWKL